MRKSFDSWAAEKKIDNSPSSRLEVSYSNLIQYSFLFYDSLSCRPHTWLVGRSARSGSTFAILWLAESYTALAQLQATVADLFTAFFIPNRSPIYWLSIQCYVIQCYLRYIHL